MTADMLQKAKTLRKHQTDAEQKLWFHLRGKRFSGVKFKRQKPIGFYVVDFVAINEKLIIELDGGQHQERMTYDQERTNYLESCGYRVLRFWNNECLTEIEAVLERIWRTLFPDEPSPPTPLPQAGEGRQGGDLLLAGREKQTAPRQLSCERRVNIPSPACGVLQTAKGCPEGAEEGKKSS